LWLFDNLNLKLGSKTVVPDKRATASAIRDPKPQVFVLLWLWPQFRPQLALVVMGPRVRGDDVERLLDQIPRYAACTCLLLASSVLVPCMITLPLSST